MDLLSTAVVDLITLVATCHALRPAEGEAAAALQGAQRSRLRRDIKRATLAYIDTLARTKRGMVDDALLARCRVAAEQQMPRALEQQAWLARLMDHQAGSLDGLAAARQDLWRLAHMTVHLRLGMDALREQADTVNTKAADSLASRLRRRFRKALIAYARATLRDKASSGKPLAKARQAALEQVGKRGVAEAELLADIEADAVPARKLIWLGVTNPLLDLGLDWQGTAPEPPQDMA